MKTLLRPNTRVLTLGLLVSLLCTVADARALIIDQMVTDYARPYVYGLHRGNGNNDGKLLFINAGSGEIEKIIPIGSNPTDMTLHHGEGKLYVTDWGHPFTRVVDLATQVELPPPLSLPGNAYKINAGRPGRVYSETLYGFGGRARIIDTATGNDVRALTESLYTGDGEVDPSGSWYYRSEERSFGRITKYDIRTDTPSSVATNDLDTFGSSDLVMSGDGSRLFWRGHVYDADLNELADLGEEIYATSLHGELAFSSTHVYGASTGAELYELDGTATPLALSGDQSKLFYFDEETASLEIVPMSEIAELPVLGLTPIPADGIVAMLPVADLAWDIQPTALTYQVYFGSSALEVGEADTDSPLYLGESSDTSMEAPEALELGQTYYWRVDIVEFSGLTTGEVWSLKIAPIVVDPNALSSTLPSLAPPQSWQLELTAGDDAVAWTASEELSWLTIEEDAGTTPTSLTVTLYPGELAVGSHAGEIIIEVEGFVFALPVDFELVETALTQMVADYERPYIYALHRGSESFDDAFLLFIHTGSGEIEKVVPIGSNPTDMTLHQGEGRLYVTNWGHPFTRVVDLVTQMELAPLSLGNDVYRINAGRPGRIYYEVDDESPRLRIIDTTTGNQVGALGGRGDEGDGEVDPTGSWYYHGGYSFSSQVAKYDIRTDTPSWVAESRRHPYGSRNLLMSGDGSRLFWQGYVYDADLNELGYLGGAIYATNFDGSIAYGSSKVFGVASLASIFDLPLESRVMAYSHDTLELYAFDDSRGEVVIISMDGDADDTPLWEDNCLDIANATQLDQDLDDVGDLCDAFPEDSTEWSDRDGDRAGDNTDVFPDDPSESNDRDRDGIGDNADEFPDDPTEWSDSDGDGVGDNTDTYPDDPTRSEHDYTLHRGDILVTASENGIIKIDAATGEQLQFAWLPGFNPADLTISPDGEIYTTSSNSSAIHHIDPRTREIRLIADWGSLNTIMGISMAENGDLLVADAYQAAVIRIDLRDGMQTLIPVDAPRLLTPFDVVETGDGHLVVSDGHRITKIDPVSLESVVVAEGMRRRLYSIHLAAPDKLLTTIIADCQGCHENRPGIVRIDLTDGKRYVVDSSLSFARDLATESNGVIVVTLPTDAAVSRVGEGHGKLTSGGYLSGGPGGIAIMPVDVVPVPEPNGLALAALAVLLSLRWRRNGARGRADPLGSTRS